ERRPLHLFLSSTKEHGEISLWFFPLLGERRDLSRSVALFDDKATSLPVAVVEEGKRRALSPFLSSSWRKTASSLSNEPKDGRIKRRDQGFSDKSRTITHNKSHTIKSHMIKVNLCLCSVELDKTYVFGLMNWMKH
ncbi:hypothetical protein HID58_081457, partial [Brassica napus]